MTTTYAISKQDASDAVTSVFADLFDSFIGYNSYLADTFATAIEYFDLESEEDTALLVECVKDFITLDIHENFDLQAEDPYLDSAFRDWLDENTESVYAEMGNLVAEGFTIGEAWPIAGREILANQMRDLFEKIVSSEIDLFNLIGQELETFK